MKTIPVCEDCVSPSSAVAVVVSGWKRGSKCCCTATGGAVLCCAVHESKVCAQYVQSQHRHVSLLEWFYACCIHLYTNRLPFLMKRALHRCMVPVVCMFTLLPSFSV